MDIKDIKKGENYIIDPENRFRKRELTSAIVGKVVKIPMISFSNNVMVAPYTKGNSEPDMDLLFTIRSVYLMPISENPEKNVVVRYPEDVPAFSTNDVAIIAKAAAYVVDHCKDANFNDGELLALSGLIDKIEFYSDIK